MSRSSECGSSWAGPAAVIAAGHSLGEYAALVAARSLGFFHRGFASAREGSLDAGGGRGGGKVGSRPFLGLDDEQVISICVQASAHQHVSAVNFNAPGQVAIAGHADAVERATELARNAGAKRAIRLPLSVPVSL